MNRLAGRRDPDRRRTTEHQTAEHQARPALLTPARAFTAAAVLAGASLTVLATGPRQPPPPASAATAASMVDPAPTALTAASPATTAPPMPPPSSTTPPSAARSSTAPGPAATSRSGATQWPSDSDRLPPAVPDPLAGPVSDAYLQQVLAGTSPTDLAPGQEQALVALGRRVLLADLTGVGRSAFSGYFDGPATTTWRQVQINAGIARTAPGQRTLVDVTLIWSATTPAGQPVTRQRSVVRLHYDGRGWSPRHRT